MIRFNLILFFCCTIFTACKTKYATKEFKVSQIPLSPNYNSLESWAAHPEKSDSIIDVFYTTEKENLKADVFYIYPTLLTSKKMMHGTLMFLITSKIVRSKTLLLNIKLLHGRMPVEYTVHYTDKCTTDHFMNLILQTAVRKLEKSHMMTLEEHLSII